ncbi:hypothetical protein AAVH_15270 [Aphelenchoides avenae]|nr:hypothetical protein AAVH_15270 [Aphelenchus avenae]
MVRRNQPRRARPRNLGDRALRDWLLQRRAEGWEGLDDEEDVEDEDFVADEVAVVDDAAAVGEAVAAGEDVVENAGGLGAADFDYGEWEDDNVVPLDLIEDLQQREEEEAAAQAEELPPRTGLTWPPDALGEGYPCALCQERVGTAGPPMACPFCGFKACLPCIRRHLESGRVGERDDLNHPLPIPCCPQCREQVRDEDGWLPNPQRPGENFAFRDVLGEFHKLRQEAARLRAENERLQEQAQAAEALRAQNVRLRAEVAELSRRLGGLIVEDDDEEQAGPEMAVGGAPVAQEVGALVPVVAASASAPVVVRRDDTFNDGQQPGPSGLVPAGQVAVRRGGSPVDGQQAGPSGVVARQWTAGRRRVPSRFRNAAGLFVCPECPYRTPHRGHADAHFRTHAGSDVHAAWQMEQQERRGRPIGGGGPHRRERRRHRVRGTMAFEFEEEEEIEYENYE